MSKTEKQRIEAILDVFDSAVDLGDFQSDVRARFEAELKITGELDFLSAEPVKSDHETLKERYVYLKLGGSWDMLTTDARETYLAGFEDAMKTLGVKP